MAPAGVKAEVVVRRKPMCTFDREWVIAKVTNTNPFRDRDCPEVCVCVCVCACACANCRAFCIVYVCVCVSLRYIGRT